jgi:hypothetical protein
MSCLCKFAARPWFIAADRCLMRSDLSSCRRDYVTYAKTIAPVWSTSETDRVDVGHCIDIFKSSCVSYSSRRGDRSFDTDVFIWKIAQGARARDAGARKDVSLDTWRCWWMERKWVVGRQLISGSDFHFQICRAARFVVVFGAGFACASRLAPNALIRSRSLALSQERPAWLI